MTKHKRKHYNPFKMWGSYVGAAVPIIFFREALLELFNGKYNEALNLCLTEPTEVLQSSCTMVMHAFLGMMLLTIPIGFLIGWGIHSLVRKLM